LSTTVLQSSVATRVTYDVFNDLFIANVLLSVMVKEFWRSVRIRQSYGKKSSGTFFLDTVYNWVKVGTVTLKWAVAVSRGILRICRGGPRNLANGAAEFGKICRGKLWSLLRKIIWRVGSLATLSPLQMPGNWRQSLGAGFF